VEDVLMTCPFFRGVCTYTVAARPETTVVVAVTAPVQAVVTVVNDTVAGADWTGTTMEDDKEDVVDEAEDDDLVDREDDEAPEADEVDEVLEATDEEEDNKDEDELDDADEETALDEEATLDEDRGSTLATIDGRDVGRETTLDDEAATAGQLLGFELMLSATLVRLK
jgi:hypothetical protein